MKRTANKLKPGDLFLVTRGLGKVTRLTDKRVYFEFVAKRNYDWEDKSPMPGANVRGGFRREPFIDIYPWRSEKPVGVEVVRDEKMYREAVNLSRELQRHVTEAYAEAERQSRRRDAAVRAALRWRYVGD